MGPPATWPHYFSETGSVTLNQIELRAFSGKIRGHVAGGPNYPVAGGPNYPIIRGASQFRAAHNSVLAGFEDHGRNVVRAASGARELNQLRALVSQGIVAGQGLLQLAFCCHAVQSVTA